MAAKNYIKVALVTLLTLALVICAMPMAFATDTVADEVTEDVVESESTGDTTAESPAETDAPESGNADAADTAEGTDTEAVGDTGSDEEKKGITTGTIVSIAIVAVIVVFAAVYCIKNREKVAKFFREVKSECKKIVWTPWKTVRKNLLIVLIVLVVFIIAIGALDLMFHKGIIALGDLI
ncbi:MAG: preprotein translocase subunit SecE [Clostridia bacterium]|nr:preprotein translocase subunit SecE [Clostridia bacterium]